MQVIDTHRTRDIESIIAHTGSDADIADLQVFAFPGQGADLALLAAVCMLGIVIG